MTKYISILFCFVFVSCFTDHEHIYAETFDQNDIGWVEENTDHHELEIKDGKYRIHCKDTSITQTSASALRTPFLFSLPKTYEINTTVKFIDGQKNNELGLILVSASIYYRFGIFSNGDTEVIKYDRNSDRRTTVCSVFKEDLKFNKGDKFTVKIVVSDRSFEYSINDNLVCEGEFQAKQWEDLRLFSSSTTIVEFDDLIFKKPN